MRIITAIVLICLLGTLSFAGCKKNSEDGLQKAGNVDMLTDRTHGESADKSGATATEGESADKSGVTATEGQQNAQMQEEQKPVETEKDGGGNEFDGEKKEEVTKISVLVSKEEYFCDNAPMELDEIISKVQSVKGKLMVEVTDNNATLKAYDKLLEKLKELEISVIEK